MEAHLKYVSWKLFFWLGAGVSSLALSILGITAGFWDGFAVNWNAGFVWPIPAVTLPAFFIAIRFRRLGIVCLWLIPILASVLLILDGLARCIDNYCPGGLPSFLDKTVGSIGFLYVLFWLPAISAQLAQRNPHVR